MLLKKTVEKQNKLELITKTTSLYFTLTVKKMVTCSKTLNKTLNILKNKAGLRCSYFRSSHSLRNTYYKVIIVLHGTPMSDSYYVAWYPMSDSYYVAWYPHE